MPLFDQSGRKHVRLLGSKISTLCQMASVTAVLESINALSCSSDHENLRWGLKNGLTVAKNVTKLHEVCYLVDQTKPTPQVCYFLGGRKVLKSVQELWQRRFVDTETSKVNRRSANWTCQGGERFPSIQPWSEIQWYATSAVVECHHKKSYHQRSVLYAQNRL